jgi:prepilin-type N-terminal cleavage/methylation domain-containing protein
MKKGFTLIELLVVIAILAVLAVAVVLVLNPVQLIKQARDSTRISDLATLNSAISFYLADVASPDLGICTSTYGRFTAATTTSSFATAVSTSSVTGRGVDGTGWIDINFATTTGGSPIGRLPLDPVNSITGGNNYFYGYACDDTNKYYELNANMESTKYASGGTGDVESVDGGDNSGWYEVGNRLVL